MQQLRIDYDHDQNPHSSPECKIVLERIFADDLFPETILDVGCGIGTWLSAARELGAHQVVGVDGVSVRPERLLVDPSDVFLHDLTTPLSLGRRFSLVLCLEVGEHLETCHSRTLVESLVHHGDDILFSAACPKQPGQHHVNLQWPEYWQKIFNQFGYACSDEVRWMIWDDQAVSPWYRQNMFRATRNESAAGREPRVKGVVHPDMLPFIMGLSRHLPRWTAPAVKMLRQLARLARLRAT